MPGLKDLRANENQLQKQLANSTGLGVSQAFNFGQKAFVEYVRVSFHVTFVD